METNEKEIKEMIYNIYKQLISNMDLSNVSYGEDVILCGGVCIAGLLDAIIISYLTMLLINILLVSFTNKGIVYWFKKLADRM